MISETVENVKGKIRKIVHDLNEHISKPQQKYLLEMIPGCFPASFEQKHRDIIMPDVLQQAV